MTKSNKRSLPLKEARTDIHGVSPMNFNTPTIAQSGQIATGIKRSVHLKDAPTACKRFGVLTQNSTSRTYTLSQGSATTIGQEASPKSEVPSAANTVRGFQGEVSPQLTFFNIAHSGDPAMTLSKAVLKVQQIVSFSKRLLEGVKNE
jgi:hypothetical protein